jgi:valyl-tRNA synthetase
MSDCLIFYSHYFSRSPIPHLTHILKLCYTAHTIPASVAAKKKEKELKKKEAAEKAAEKAAAKKQAEAANGSAAPKAKKEKPVKETAASDETPFVNPTPPGEKKDLSGAMAESYNPTVVEASWDTWWQKVGVYQPHFDADGKPKAEGTFCVPLPPPNVTGALHCGHALTVAVQDCLARWYRMSGKTVLYTPGFDHAGISTQSVVEKRLWKDQKLTRHDLGREKMVEKIFEWKDQYQARIEAQMRRLGASCDWDRAVFTMDEPRYKAVMQNFVTLHERGLIYRANRLVNWCCMLRTTLSNLEVGAGL